MREERSAGFARNTDGEKSEERRVRRNTNLQSGLAVVEGGFRNHRESVSKGSHIQIRRLFRYVQRCGIPDLPRGPRQQTSAFELSDPD